MLVYVRPGRLASDAEAVLALSFKLGIQHKRDIGSAMLLLRKLEHIVILSAQKCEVIPRVSMVTLAAHGERSLAQTVY